MTESAPHPSPAADQPAAPAHQLVPTWLSRLAEFGWRILVTLALVLVFVTIAARLSTVTGAILVGLTVAAMVYPIVQRLEERGWPRARAAGAASLLAVVIVVLTLAVIILLFIPSIARVIETNRAAVASLSDALNAIGLPPAVFEMLDRAVTDFQTAILEGIAQLVGPIANFTTILILGGFLTFYLLDDGDRGWTGATANLREWQARELTDRASQALGGVGAYLRGAAALAVADGVSAAVILWILGVPFAGPLAVFVFIGGFIPYLGGLVTTTVLVLATFLARGAGGVVILLVLLAAVNLVEERVIAPRVFGPGPRLNPGLALIALAIGGAFFGMIGLFAAVPVLAAIIAFAPAVTRVLGSESRTATAPTAPGVVPAWLDRLGQVSWRTLVVLALLWVAAQAVLIPILSAPVVLAAIFACVLKPIERAARRRGAGRTAAALFATVASVVVVVAVVAVTIVSLVNSMPDIVGTATIGAGDLNFGATVVDLARSLGGGLSDAVSAFVTNVATVAISLALGLVLTFFLLRDGEALWKVLLKYVPANRQEPVDTVATTSASILYGSMVGTAIVSFAGAVLQFITMVLLGLPLAFPVSVLMFFGGFIPYVGSLIVTLIGFLIALSVGSTADVILYAVYTIVFNIVQGNIVAPLVYSKTVSVHPALVLLAAPAGAAIGGFIGMVLMVPVIAMVQQTWRIVIHLFDQDPSAAQAAAAETAAKARPAPPVEGGAASAAATGS